jgi:hypothetical protein
MSELQDVSRRGGRRKRALSAEEKLQIWLQLLTGELSRRVTWPWSQLMKCSAPLTRSRVRRRRILLVSMFMSGLLVAVWHATDRWRSAGRCVRISDCRCEHGFMTAPTRHRGDHLSTARTYWVVLGRRISALRDV